MILTIVALVALSATRVASTMPVDVIHSVQNTSTAWNAIYTPTSSSNADMESSYFDESSEERVEPPTEIKSILLNLHASRLQGLTSDQQHAMIETLTPRIEDMNKEFTRLTRAKEKGEISENSFILAWEDYVNSKYSDTPEIASKVMFVTLAHHFQGDDLPSVLVAGTKIGTMKPIFLELLHLQVNKWVELKSDPAKVFELLQLHQTNGNPTESTLFPKWVEFVESRYHNSPEEADEHMLSVLAKHFEEDDFALVKALVDGAKLRPTKVIAGKLLDFQIKAWVNKGKNLTRILELLEPTQTKGKFLASKLFTRWVDLIVSTHKTDYQKVMIGFLAEHYKGDELVSVLVPETKIPRAKRNADKLLRFQFDEWILEEKSDREVFELSVLRQTNGNPLEGPLFSRWAKFVRRQHVGSAADKEILDILGDHFGSVTGHPTAIPLQYSLLTLVWCKQVVRYLTYTVRQRKTNEIARSA